MYKTTSTWTYSRKGEDEGGGGVQYCAKRMQKNFTEFLLLFNRKLANISG